LVDLLVNNLKYDPPGQSVNNYQVLFYAKEYFKLLPAPQTVLGRHKLRFQINSCAALPRCALRSCALAAWASSAARSRFNASSLDASAIKDRFGFAA
jgi:hypothetical protein